MKKSFWIILACFFGLIAFLALPVNFYLRGVIFNGTAKITDYNFFNNRDVEKGKDQPWKISTEYNVKKIPDNYLRILTNLKTVAFLVIKDTAIVHESYYLGYNESSYSNSFSMAKSIVSLLVDCALEDGKIKSLDEPVGDFIPTYKKGANAKLTIKDLLTMSSGLNWGEAYYNPFSMTARSYYGNNLHELVNGLKVVETPGKKFKYLSGNTQLLAYIIEIATGKHLADYASEKLWKPIGAKYNALWSIDKPSGTEKAYCCFNSNARDFARIGQLVLNKGKWNGKQLVSEKYIQEATSPASWLVDEYGHDPLMYYGFQFWLLSYRGEKVIYARGILGQYIFIIPSKNMVIVRLGEKRCSLRTWVLPSDIYIWLNLGMELV